MIVKLCGLRRPEDIGFINKFKPDFAGFILSPGFKRSITEEQFYNLEKLLDKNIKRAGVFVDESPETVIKYGESINIIQLHGNEDRQYIQRLKDSVKCGIWKAVRVRSVSDIENADRLGADMLLLDSFVPGSCGGTGKTADLDIIKNADFKTPFLLAGGLNAENIESAIKKIKPFGVDISSGIETDGFKDQDKIREIINIVRSVNH